MGVDECVISVYIGYTSGCETSHGEFISDINITGRDNTRVRIRKLNCVRCDVSVICDLFEIRGYTSEK